ncbi:YdcF family protein [Treponema sp. OttesenSCG-928-L16]|nr:YdcF family protein [Treponema sp. OttesenSCG-928-L16]
MHLFQKLRNRRRSSADNRSRIKPKKRPLRILLSLLLLTAVVSFFINRSMIQNTKKYVVPEIGALPRSTAVLVLGSMVGGSALSPVLEDRVNAAISIIRAGKARKLLLSGDHGQRNYDEVNAMRLYVLKYAPEIPEEDIFMDHAGFNTYDSMYRARDVFAVKDLIIVTQEFHINRAVYIARSLGLNAAGFSVSQDRFSVRTRTSWETREYLARVKAFFSVLFSPKPEYLGDLIPITGDGRQTWD